MDERPLTWHYGLMARLWAEFNITEADELACFRRAIERFGSPALDLGCGTGRLLLPFLAAGLDVDGADISADMLAWAAASAAASGFAPALHAQALHELDLPRRYRTIFAAGVVGIGGSRAQDREGFRHVFEHLEPGGAFVFSHELPYAGLDANRWARWLPGNRGQLPRGWPTEGERRRTADGDELELIDRLADFDPLLQRRTLDVRVRRWHRGAVVEEEEYRLHECLYFEQELLLMLDDAGFRDVVVEGAYRGTPATPDDGSIVVVAQRPLPPVRMAP
jgi:SAM-dependent methyltransferase